MAEFSFSAVGSLFSDSLLGYKAQCNDPACRCDCSEPVQDLAEERIASLKEEKLKEKN